PLRNHLHETTRHAGHSDACNRHLHHHLDHGEPASSAPFSLRQFHLFLPFRWDWYLSRDTAIPLPEHTSCHDAASRRYEKADAPIVPFRDACPFARESFLERVGASRPEQGLNPYFAICFPAPQFTHEEDIRHHLEVPRRTC